MTTVIETKGLTKGDVSYLRRATDVYAINIEDRNYLRCVKRADYQDAFSEDKRVDIPVEGNGKHGWFCSVWSFPWHTIRAGDQVRFEWYPDAGTSELLREVNLHMDELYVHITRGQKSARYLAEAIVCAENSARMCRSDAPTSFG